MILDRASSYFKRNATSREHLLLESQIQDFGLIPSLKKVLSLAIWPVFGAMLFPMFAVINIYALGRYKSPEFLAGYGLGAMTISVASASPLYGFSAVAPLVG